MSEPSFHPASPYLRFGHETFLDARGREVVPAILPGTASSMFIPVDLANLLNEGGIPGGTVSPEGLRQLREVGVVVDSQDEARASHYARMRQASADPGMRKFVLLPTSYCNMGCSYCGQEHRKGSTSPRHRAVVAARVRRAAQSTAVSRIQVGWFGGEPLMAYHAIKEMSREFRHHAQTNGIAYAASIVTNGSLLTERKIATLVETCAVTRFDITLDGLADVHDAHRPLKSGAKSFDRLVGLLSQTVADPRYAHVHFVLRTNVDIENCEHVTPYLEEMARLGFGGRSNVMFQLAAIHTWGNDVRAQQMEHGAYVRREVEWLDLMTRLGLNTALLPTSPKPQTCTATGAANEVIASDGSLYSCTEHPLVPAHEQADRLAWVDGLPSTQLRPQGAFDDWAQHVGEGKAMCSSCWLLPACGGSCPKLWREGEVPCPPVKFNIKERLSIVARKAGMQTVDSFPAPSAPTVTTAPTEQVAK
ncbi:radical SAM protein [Streptomyces sp. HUAS MG91]|uniref:Radical SAM protein n=1 Tax=Streptomyces tabacisoli TaxID=3156398 RepID=A0AAU8J2C1_9ACTN